MKKAPIAVEFVGGHVEAPPSYAVPLVGAIGLAALRWGRIEQHLHGLLLSINKEDHGPTRYHPVPNAAFEKKIQIFEAWFVRDPRFAAFHDRARRLVASLRAGNKDRQSLFHANLQGFSEGPPIRATFAYLSLNGETVVQYTRDWTEPDVLKFARGMGRLNRGLHKITTEVMDPAFLGSLRIT